MKDKVKMFLLWAFVIAILGLVVFTCAMQLWGFGSWIKEIGKGSFLFGLLLVVTAAVAAIHLFAGAIRVLEELSCKMHKTWVLALYTAVLIFGTISIGIIMGR